METMKFVRRRTLLIIVVAVISLALFFVITDEDLPAAIKFDAFEKLVHKNVQSCSYEDFLEYYYYEDVPESKQKNNKFGLYVYAEEPKYIKLADQLVNSNGGDWGYVLIPYNIKDRDYTKWRKAFELLNKKHLIPVIQLWDVEPGEYKDVTTEAAAFLNTFLWPTRRRYISVYNEPNDAKFWKGAVDPENYAKVLDYTIDAFRKENPDFFMINGAFNASAPTAVDYMDEEAFMYSMEEAVPGIFEKLDGWASHPYPQPNFSGSPYSKGRWSIRAYESELSFLKNELGVRKALPVFITETGWAHAEGVNYNASYLPVSKAAENFRIAYEEVWLKDDQVVAVMPFTIWYEQPHDHFSWVDWRDVPYEHFQTIKSLKKVAGTPEKLVMEKKNVVKCE